MKLSSDITLGCIASFARVDGRTLTDSVLISCSADLLAKLCIVLPSRYHDADYVEGEAVSPLIGYVLVDKSSRT